MTWRRWRAVARHFLAHAEARGVEMKSCFSEPSVTPPYIISLLLFLHGSNICHMLRFEDPRGLFLINYEQLGCTKNSPPPPRDAPHQRKLTLPSQAHTRAFLPREIEGLPADKRKKTFYIMSQQNIIFWFA